MTILTLSKQEALPPNYLNIICFEYLYLILKQIKNYKMSIVQRFESFDLVPFFDCELQLLVI